MTVSRRDAREFLATLIRAQSVLAQAVFAYLPSDFAGASPIIVVTGAGSERPRMTLRGTKTVFHLVVETFVLYSDPDATPPWTAKDAEDTMDGLENEIAQIASDNGANSHWSLLTYETTSNVSKVNVGGVAYLYEAIPLNVEVL